MEKLFEQAAKQLSFSVIRKQMQDLSQLEALLMGQLSLLEATDLSCPYYRSLQEEYQYLAHKYALVKPCFRVQFTKLRPPNFPHYSFGTDSCAIPPRVVTFLTDV